MTESQNEEEDIHPRMQQLLSYQTAMRANDERDVRAYITKRTCVSLIFSIGFFTLVIGFLLGKFVTTRQYRVKQLQEPEVISLIKYIPHIKSKAEITGHQLTEHSTFTKLENDTMGEYFRPYNMKLWNKMLWCGRNIDFNFNVKLDVFIGAIVDKEVDRIHGCLKEIRMLISDNDLIN